MLATSLSALTQSGPPPPDRKLLLSLNFANAPALELSHGLLFNKGFTATRSELTKSAGGAVTHDRHGALGRDIVLGTDPVRHAGLSHFRPSATLAMPALAQISSFSSPDAASKHKPSLDGIRSSDQTD